MVESSILSIHYVQSETTACAVHLYDGLVSIPSQQLVRKAFSGAPQDHPARFWATVKDFKVSYYNEEALWFTIHPYSGDLIQVPEQQPRIFFYTFWVLVIVSLITQQLRLQIIAPDRFRTPKP